MIESRVFHPDVQQALVLAGWFSKRKIPISAWRESIIRDSFGWFPLADQILSEFGHLTIQPVEHPEAVFGSGPFVVNPENVLDESERLHQREAIIGEDVIPIGEWCDEYIILITPTGRVFAETSYRMVRVGGSIHEALECMIRAHRRPHLIGGVHR